MSGPVPAVRALACPNCGAPVALRAAGYTVSFVCGACGSTLDASTPELRLVARADEAMRRPPIPLGTRGRLSGDDWEVIGCLLRTDGEASWSESLLFNPYVGYRFLVLAEGRFSLGRLLDGDPRTEGERVRWRDRTYEPDGESGYAARVTFVVGEFYWRVAVGETARVSEFVGAGATLALEETDAERTWTRLEPLAPGEAERAFGLPPPPARPVPRYAGLLRLWCAIAAATIVALFVIRGTAPDEAFVFAREEPVTLEAPTRTVVLGRVEQTEYAPIRIDASARGLDNDWIDVDYSLVERGTQASYDAYALLEYYRGVDSDGSWSEGTLRERTSLARVPPGSYDLVAEIAGHRWVQGAGKGTTAPGPTETAWLGVSVTRGGSFAAPFVAAIVLVLFGPGLVYLIHLSYGGSLLDVIRRP